MLPLTLPLLLLLLLPLLIASMEEVEAMREVAAVTMDDEALLLLPLLMLAGLPLLPSG